MRLYTTVFSLFYKHVSVKQVMMFIMLLQHSDTNTYVNDFEWSYFDILLLHRGVGDSVRQFNWIPLVQL